MSDAADLVTNFKDLLERHEQLAESATSRRGQRARNKPSRLHLEIAFRFVNSTRPAGMNAACQTIISHAYPPCCLPFAELTRITIRELRLETVHRGRILIVRTFGHPIRMQAVQNAVEDELGDVDRLALYNVDPDIPKEEVLPTGAVFAVKEPFYKATADGGYIVRVDHPSDLIKLDNNDERIPAPLQPKLVELTEHTGADLKNEGNIAFKKKNYRTAIEYYTKGLKRCSVAEQNHVLRSQLFSNRSLAKFCLQRYEGALEDAEAAVVTSTSVDAAELDRLNVKAFYRAGRAAYLLRDYIKARQMYQSVQSIKPDDCDTAQEQGKIDKRLNEASNGAYDFMATTNSFSTHSSRLDCADFIKKIEVRQTMNRGRSAFAVKDIIAGELLLCEKAFCIAFDSEESNDMNAIFNLNTKTGAIGSDTTRLVRTVQKLLHNPKQARTFFDLYDGGYGTQSGQIVDSNVVVDTFQVQAILQKNGFGSSAPYSSPKTPKDEKSNGFTGVWITCSYINHDCIGNACFATIGDVMIMHATKDIKCGEEITIPYKTAALDYTVFQESLQKSWGFKCTCALCVADYQTSALQRGRRREAVEEAQGFLKANPVRSEHPTSALTITQCEKLRQAVESTYDTAAFLHLPRKALLELDIALCHMHTSRLSVPGLRRSALATLRDLGYELTVKPSGLVIRRQHCHPDTLAIHAAMYLAETYRIESRTVAQQLESLAKEVYVTIFGSLVGFDKKFK